MSGPQAELTTASCDKLNALVQTMTELKVDLASISQAYIDKEIGLRNTVTLHIHAIDNFISVLKAFEGHRGLHIEELKQRVSTYCNEHKIGEFNAKLDLEAKAESKYFQSVEAHLKKVDECYDDLFNRSPSGIKGECGFGDHRAQLNTIGSDRASQRDTATTYRVPHWTEMSSDSDDDEFYAEHSVMRRSSTFTENAPTAPAAPGGK